MKKIISIALTLTLILALAVSGSAASLASSWTEIVNSCVDGGGIQEGAGEATVDANGYIFLDNSAPTPHSNYSKASVVYNSKIAVDGLEIVLKPENLFNAPGLPGKTDGYLTSYFSVNLSADKPTDFVPFNAADTSKNPMAGAANGLNYTNATGAAATFALDGGIDNWSWTLFGGWISAISVDFAHCTGNWDDNTDMTLKFVVSGDTVKILINGEDTGVSFAKSAVLDSDGKAYLSFLASGFGAANTNLTIKTINGSAANSFTASAGAPAGPADIEVVAIAGAMIVALMAAAFVVKARKA
ncbi:MAG: hypothetical protein IJD95_01475 [Clostridia bacterium]|nr:hypothetical protein [Clostridia bacterium]